MQIHLEKKNPKFLNYLVWTSGRRRRISRINMWIFRQTSRSVVDVCGTIIT